MKWVQANWHVICSPDLSLFVEHFHTTALFLPNWSSHLLSSAHSFPTKIPVSLFLSFFGHLSHSMWFSDTSLHNSPPFLPAHKQQKSIMICCVLLLFLSLCSTANSLSTIKVQWIVLYSVSTVCKYLPASICFNVELSNSASLSLLSLLRPLSLSPCVCHIYSTLNRYS